jgi:hypothetical protein
MEWINVKDKLPEPHKDVLFYDSYEPCPCYIVGHCWGNGMFIANENTYHFVSHWMELPERPFESKK